jgi:cytochrome c biogenesis factor
MADKIPSGAAVAAYLSAMVGLLVMGIVHTMTDASASFSTWGLSVGKLWIPNAQGIGPYSGKETYLLLTWLFSWAILHMLLRKRDIKLAAPVVIFVAGMALATLFVYTPFIDFILGK